MPTRGRSTTPLQSLNLLNSQFVLQQSALLASHVEYLVGSDANDQVVCLFERLFGRQPSSTEVDLTVPLIQHHGLPALCRAMINTNEFLFLP